MDDDDFRNEGRARNTLEKCPFVMQRAIWWEQKRRASLAFSASRSLPVIQFCVP